MPGSPPSAGLGGRKWEGFLEEEALKLNLWSNSEMARQSIPDRRKACVKNWRQRALGGPNVVRAAGS